MDARLRIAVKGIPRDKLALIAEARGATVTATAAALLIESINHTYVRLLEQDARAMTNPNHKRLAATWRDS